MNSERLAFKNDSVRISVMEGFPNKLSIGIVWDEDARENPADYGMELPDVDLSTEDEEKLHELLEKRIKARLSQEIMDRYRQEGFGDVLIILQEGTMNIASLKEHLSQLQHGKPTPKEDDHGMV